MSKDYLKMAECQPPLTMCDALVWIREPLMMETVSPLVLAKFMDFFGLKCWAVACSEPVDVIEYYAEWYDNCTRMMQEENKARIMPLLSAAAPVLWNFDLFGERDWAGFIIDESQNLLGTDRMYRFIFEQAKERRVPVYICTNEDEVLQATRYTRFFEEFPEVKVVLVPRFLSESLLGLLGVYPQVRLTMANLHSHELRILRGYEEHLVYGSGFPQGLRRTDHLYRWQNKNLYLDPDGVTEPMEAVYRSHREFCLKLFGEDVFAMAFLNLFSSR